MRLFLSSLVVWSVITATTLAEPVTYDVGTVNLYYPAPPSLVSNYVLTGTITTNGTIGPLSASDFISWSLQVDGPIPFHFHPGNPNASVTTSFASASVDALTISGQFGSLFIDTEETPGCADCLKRVFWRAWGIGDVSYQTYDDNGVLFATTGFTNEDPFVIATRVPEPSSITALVAAAICCGPLGIKRSFACVAR